MTKKKIEQFLIVTAIFLFALFTYSEISYAQKKDNGIVKNVPDFRLIETNDSYVEFEFIPKYTDDLHFSNQIKESQKPGVPDVGLRSFPVLIPGKQNNRIEIVDSKFEEVINTDIKPVPRYVKDKNKNVDIPEYDADDKLYSSSKFYPGSSAEFIFSGSLRNKYIGYANLYPLSYNPVSSTLMKYSYMRVRVVFGGTPVYGNRDLSNEEKIFLSQTGINWFTAKNWSTLEFNSVRDLPIVNSVFSSGDFYKLEVKETAIYKLDKTYLRNAVINIDNINQKTIKIFGNDGTENP